MAKIDDRPLPCAIVAVQLAQLCSPQKPWTGTVLTPVFHALGDHSMYTLVKAREEIQTLAKHTTDIAAHAITTAAELDATLSRLKADILSAIDEKFAEMTRTFMADPSEEENTAITDLGAKVSLLTQRRTAPSDQQGGPPSHDHPHPEGRQEWQGHEGHRQD